MNPKLVPSLDEVNQMKGKLQKRQEHVHQGDKTKSQQRRADHIDIRNSRFDTEILHVWNLKFHQQDDFITRESRTGRTGAGLYATACSPSAKTIIEPD
jgi:hypothetical protein